jgi:hypothetical protein
LKEFAAFELVFLLRIPLIQVLQSQEPGIHLLPAQYHPLSTAGQEPNQPMRPQFRRKLLFPQLWALSRQTAGRQCIEKPLIFATVAYSTAVPAWLQPGAVRRKLPRAEMVAGHFREYSFLFPCLSFPLFVNMK